MVYIYGSGTYVNRFHAVRYSRTPFIRTLVVRITNYPERLDLSGKPFLTVLVLHLLLLKFPPSPPRYQIHLRNYVLMF
jgi:hypothetical protein